jgi:hypothetical protein
MSNGNRQIDERATKLEARLCAIEFAICELFSVFYLGVPARQIHKRHDALLKQFQRHAVSGVDPVVSDLLSAEAENAFRSILVGCSTGRSAGFAPLKILSTKVAAR